MNGTTISYTAPPTMLTAAGINFQLAPAPYPTAPDTPYEDPYARIVDLAIERDSYRVLTQQLMEALAHVTRERDQLREQRRIDRQASQQKAAA